MRRVLLFRSELLPVSETFIAAQAGALRRYEPWFAGLRRVPGGPKLEEARTITATQGDDFLGRISRRAFLQFGYAPKFTRQLNMAGAELIHAHFATDAAAALAVKKELQVPMFVTLHGYDVTSCDRSLASSASGRNYLRQRHLLWARASMFVCVSEWIREKALERGFPTEKLWVHRIGIDVNKFRPGAMAVKEPLVLFVGRLVEKKGCTYLLQAMRKVGDAAPGAHLVVVGDGPLRSALEAEARYLSIPCEFVGASGGDKVRNWMSRAMVVVVPSVTAANGDAEGLCTVVLEAQAMGVPVVAFAGPGIAVVDGETGLLAPERDTLALADAILTLLRDGALAARMGTAGRKVIEKQFNLETQTAILEEKYDDVLLRRGHWQ